MKENLERVNGLAKAPLSDLDGSWVHKGGEVTRKNKQA